MVKSSKINILPLKNWQIKFEIFDKLHDSILRHVYIFNSQEPHWCYPNCLQPVFGQSRPLTLPNLCVTSSTTIIKWQNFTGALCRNPGERREIFINCFRRGLYLVDYKRDSRALTVLYRSQWVFAVLFVIFFPGHIIAKQNANELLSLQHN